MDAPLKYGRLNLPDVDSPSNEANLTSRLREIATFAAARDFAHLANHPDRLPAAAQFLHDEAVLILTLTAALAARRLRGQSRVA